MVVAAAAPRRLALVALAAALGALAALAPPPPYLTDRDIYEQIGREVVVADCSSLHCTRVLVAAVLGRLPGPGVIKWKTYAVLATVAAAAGSAGLAARLGFGTAAASLAAVLVAFGAGCQLTLFDPYSSDPLIYALAPWTVRWVMDGRYGTAVAAASIGVLAKEFAAAPLWIAAIYGALERRRDVWTKALAAAASATTVWLLFLFWLIVGHNYSFAGSPSSQLLEGGYLATWIPALGLVRAVATLVVHLGPLALVTAAAWRRTPSTVRTLALASVPAALALCYVQQPDRALWNFAFVLAPIAASGLARADRWPTALFVAGYALVNARAITERVPALLLPAFAVAAAASVVIARAAFTSPVATARPDAGRPPRVTAIGRPARYTLALAVLALAAALVAAADIAAHRRLELQSGWNVHGYRGPVARQKEPDETRVVVLGGREALGDTYQGSIPLYLQDYLNNERLRQDGGFASPGQATVINLATPYDVPASFGQTLHDFEGLRYDLVCFYLGPTDRPPSPAAARRGWRRQSLLFRTIGYQPILPHLWPPGGTLSAEERAADDPGDANALAAAIADLVARGRRAVVAAHPFVGDDDRRRLETLTSGMRRRFAGNAHVAAIDLWRSVDPADPHLVAGGVHPTVRGNSAIAESLSQTVFRVLRQP